MIATVNGKTFIVKWKHDNNGKEKKSVTHCVIRSSDSKEVVCAGQSICDTRDQYNRQTGRKISLSRALNVFDNSNDRKVFWDSYDKEIGLVK